MSIFYGTFGWGHGQRALRDHYIEIEAGARVVAERVMYQHFGEKWSMIYDARDFEPEHFPLGPISLEKAKRLHSVEEVSASEASRDRYSEGFNDAKRLVEKSLHGGAR